MLIRLRSRDGLERVEVPNGATVADLRRAISIKLGIPEGDISLSSQPGILTEKQTPSRYLDLSDTRKGLSAAGVSHGDMVYMQLPFEREVQSAVRRTPFAGRSFGSKMTVDDLIAKQTRIERQETPNCASVSFERHAANAFQQYILSGLAFSIKRGGILYGSADAEGNVLVQAIYEPPQDATADSLALERQTDEERRADTVAAVFGWEKVGWIFAQSAGERSYILSVEEVGQMASWQAELGGRGVTGVVSMSPDGDVHFEAFQAKLWRTEVSDQCVRLHKEGWFVQQAEPSGLAQLRDPKEPKKQDPVIVAGKDVGEVDVDYFLIPVNIRDHEGPLHAGFPIENRLLPQGPVELRQHLQKTAKLPSHQRLADFHLLLYLARQPNLSLEDDVVTIAEAVKHRATVPEGYTLIIDSLAMG